MLPGEMTLPEGILPLAGQAVNQLFQMVSLEADTWLAHELLGRLKELQRLYFQDQCAIHNCPSCGASKIIRKGWRSRILGTSRGKIRLLVLQACCKACGRVFRPLNDALGLPFARRFLDELVEKGIKLGTQFSFARSANTIRELTSGNISAEGIRQKIAERAHSIEMPDNVSGQTVMVDATKAKAGPKERGVPIHLAITAVPGPFVAGRPSIVKKLVHLHAGGIEPLRVRLKGLSPDIVVHDGGDDLAGCAKHVQRCRWHLSHQLYHYLWQDGIAHKDRDLYQNQLKTILWTGNNRKQRYDQFVKELESLGLKTAAGHLKAAGNEAFTFLEAPEITYSTTSPLEREMRELNRRADVGVRWSTPGVENVLKVLFHYRLNLKPET
jgi:hypothetical protein